MKLLSPTKAVNLWINSYPSRYASDDRELSKLRVYDQIFNVIGNGIRDTDEFKQALRNRRKGVQTPPAKYTSGEPLFWGYTRAKEYGEGEYKIAVGDIDSSLDGVFTEEEKQHHPEVKVWVQCRIMGGEEGFVPYPNFDKKYSTVWQIDRSILTREWIDEIAWFYRKCEQFFDGPDAHRYHRALPIDPKKLERRVEDMERALVQYRKGATIEEQWASITKAYGVEYRGDILDFMQRRWEEEYVKIREFITETIDLLEK